MRFSSTEDIEHPIEHVFERVTHFETFERAAIRRGIEIERGSDSVVPVIGMTWQARFQLRGRTRNVLVTLTEIDRPNLLRFSAAGQLLDGVFVLDLLPLAPGRTRMSVVTELAPKTLSARLVLQSMKLARSSLNKRYRGRIREFVAGL